ncbi:hypothetical protein BGZ96_003993 [Linnemannia gamsii]|uniref:Uncharacterized protein n=1 Tax=Linnemannia gamsii TaxID=64522 RepID=A0ABQ7K683_9FUNG|nr:hypothetical protein BGZ96_003993 [Linnemannia gamsii]
MGLQPGDETASEDENEDDVDGEEGEPKGWSKKGAASVSVSMWARIPTGIAHILLAMDISAKS